MKKWFAFAAALAFAACSGSGNGTTGGATQAPAPPLKNITDIPLYANAAVVTAHDFTQNVQVPATTNGSVFASGNGTYTGQEVIASSDATFGALSTWLGQLTTNPPSGYAPVETGANPEQRAQAQKYGLDYATFVKTENGKRRGLLVIVMDPQRVDARFGAILSMVAKYRALPAIMRAPIDNEAKSRFGMSISEATQPESPIGAALTALDQFEHKSSRGIVVIEASKK